MTRGARRTTANSSGTDLLIPRARLVSSQPLRTRRAAAARAVCKEEIMTILKNKLAKYKHPKAIMFIDELPRNTMGKVQKNILRLKYKEYYN